MGLRRYPGATPFSSKQEKIFYGRDKDIDKLLTLIQVEKKVLLYSKSGLGKTSLLEAGVIPKLPKKFVPISIRFYANTEGGLSPVGRVINALEKAVGKLDKLPETVLDSFPDEKGAKSTLWYWFKKLQLADNSGGDDEAEEEKTYLLVFDQFEELFSYSPRQIEEFKNQFYALTEVKVPDRYAALIAEGRRNDRNLFNRGTIGLLNKKVNVKTVFAIRSDRLSLLNNLSDKITDIQSVFYEIKPLDNNQARDAVVKPAGDTDPVFDTRPFTFHPNAIDKIINELTDEGRQNIETTQLQIVCHRIEEIADEKGGEDPKQPVEIKVEDLPEFKNIFYNFYNDSIGKIPPASQADAKRLIEDELIRNGQRISLDEEICKEYITDDELKQLVDTHLLRAERNSFGRFSYEVSHDTLVEPILESQKKYIQEQERLRLEKERQEELRKLKEKQEQEKREREEELKRIREVQRRKEQERLRKLKQQRRVTMIVTFFLIVSISLGIWGFVNYRESSRQRDIAEQKEETANRALRQLKVSQFIRNRDAGDEFREDGQYSEAIDKYRTALLFDSVLSDTTYNYLAGLRLNDYLKTLDTIDFPDTANILEKIRESKRALDNRQTYEKTFAEAEALYSSKQYVEALRKYIEAHRLGYNLSATIQRKKDEALGIYQKDLEDYREIPDQELIDITNQRISALRDVYSNFNR